MLVGGLRKNPTTIAGNRFSRRDSSSRWPHRFAVLLAASTLLLIWVGAMVTTYQAGMAVPDWPTTYGYNLFLYPWTAWWHGPFDLFIEHGHRLLGATVGIVTIGLVLVSWSSGASRLMRWAALLALVLVIGQGILGGFRVLNDARMLAMVHGCIAPAFFGYTVALCALSSGWWSRNQDAKREGCSQGIVAFAWAAALATVLYLQIFLGAQVRHVGVMTEPSVFRWMVVFHLIVAGFVLFLSLGVYRVVWKNGQDPWLRRNAMLLTCLVLVQLLLGVSTWVLKYGWPGILSERFAWAARTTLLAGSLHTALVVTAHVTTGSVLFGLAVWLALRTGRPLIYRHADDRSCYLEGVVV